MFSSLVLLLLGSISYVYCWTGIEKSSTVSVIGGEPVPISEVPFMTSLLKHGTTHHCGGAIIHKRFILTAAHCINATATYKVLVGTNDIKKGGKIYDVEKIIPHRRYTNKTMEFDICLVKVTEDITFGPTVEKVKALPDNQFKYRDRMMFNITGWGSIDVHSTKTNILQQASIPFVKSRICQKKYEIKITGRMFCAGGEKGKSSCNGDSGGPVMWNGMLVGITSFGAKGNCLYAPTVYAKVSVMRPWIMHTIDNN